jgi:hypothetical protein
MKRIWVALICVLGLVVVDAPSAMAGPCSHEWAFSHPGRSRWKQVNIQSVAPTTADPSYEGLIVRPKKLPPGTRKVPGVVILHGRGGSKCALWWAARLLASRRYITLVLTVPPGDAPKDATRVAAIAARSAIRFLRSPADPYRAKLVTNDLGLVGHSQGSQAASVVQGTAKYVRAIVGLDNLRHFAVFDPGGIGCEGPHGLVKPRVPGLGVGSETGCQDNPSLTDKLRGFHAWRQRGVPAMETVLNGLEHPTFSGGPPYDATHETALKHTGYYVVNWLDRWLLRGKRWKPRRRAAVKRLLSPTPLGVPIDRMLSDMGPQFRSAAFLPGRINCEDLRGCL